MSKLSFLVPRISKTQFDSEATAFLEKYCPEALWTPMCVPIETIATEKMQLTVLEYRMSEDLSILGQICFTDGKTEIYGESVDVIKEELGVSAPRVYQLVAEAQAIGRQYRKDNP